VAVFVYFRTKEGGGGGGGGTGWMTFNRCMGNRTRVNLILTCSHPQQNATKPNTQPWKAIPSCYLQYKWLYASTNESYVALLRRTNQLSSTKKNVQWEIIEESLGIVQHLLWIHPHLVLRNEGRKSSISEKGILSATEEHVCDHDRSTCHHQNWRGTYEPFPFCLTKIISAQNK